MNETKQETNMKEVIYEALDKFRSDSPLNNNLLLREDLGIDSLKMVMLVTKLTKKLQVNILSFSDRDLVHLKSVGDLVVLFESKKEL
jgi:acyl carrier protein